MYVSFVLYLPENGQVIDRNMYEIIVYIIWIQYTCVHLFLLLFYIYSINVRIIDHKKFQFSSRLDSFNGHLCSLALRE
jgi:hypothetical protein